MHPISSSHANKRCRLAAVLLTVDDKRSYNLVALSMALTPLLHGRTQSHPFQAFHVSQGTLREENAIVDKAVSMGDAKMRDRMSRTTKSGIMFCRDRVASTSRDR